MGKIIIFSAPSGSGKSTIINELLLSDLNLAFSISATSRPPRGKEQHGVEYYFLSTAEFKRKIEAGDFLEYEEVYEGCFYGTLKSEVERLLAEGKNVVFDIDVVGGVNLKKIFRDKSLSLFIQPPCIEELEHRLRGRATDSEEVIAKRLAKAEYELSFSEQFDLVITNDIADQAVKETKQAIQSFVS